MKHLSHQRFGHFFLLDPLHEGPESLLFRAQDLIASRLVALRIIDVNRLDNRASERLARCRRDINTVSMLDDPGVVLVHEVGDAEGTPYISMALCDGPSLASNLLRSRYPTPASAVRVALEVARTLARVHQQGVFHGNLKPANLIFDAGRYRVSDFGIVHLRYPPVGREVARRDTSLQPPEQRAGLPGDVRTDIYYLGGLLYRLITGVAPPQPPRRERHGAAPGVDTHTFAGRDIPVAVQGLVNASMAPDPAKRPGTCLEFVHILEKALEEDFPAARGRHTSAGTRIVTIAPRPPVSSPRSPVADDLDTPSRPGRSPVSAEDAGRDAPRHRLDPPLQATTPPRQSAWPVIPGAIGPPAAPPSQVRATRPKAPPGQESGSSVGSAWSQVFMQGTPGERPDSARDPASPIRRFGRPSPPLDRQDPASSKNYAGIIAAVCIALLMSGVYLLSLRDQAADPGTSPSPRRSIGAPGIPGVTSIEGGVEPAWTGWEEPGRASWVAPGTSIVGIHPTPRLEELRAHPPDRRMPSPGPGTASRVPSKVAASTAEDTPGSLPTVPGGTAPPDEGSTL